MYNMDTSALQLDGLDRTFWVLTVGRLDGDAVDIQEVGDVIFGGGGEDFGGPFELDSSST